MGTDWNGKGQQDQKDSRKEDWVDIISSGGGSHHYNPPRNTEHKKEYDAGWKNAQKNPSKR